jgi:hypothetical protein
MWHTAALAHSLRPWTPEIPRGWLCAIAHRAGDLFAHLQQFEEGLMPTMLLVSCRKDFWSATEFAPTDEIRDLD